MTAARLALASLVCVALWTTATAAADRLEGTWKLNVARSNFASNPPPRSQTTRLQSVDGGLREIVNRVNADGTTTQWELTAQYDGKDYPVKGDPSRDTVSLRKIDDNTVDVVNKKNGTVTTRMRIVVAADGKTRTNTVTGTDAKGQAMTMVMLFDRE